MTAIYTQVNPDSNICSIESYDPGMAAGLTSNDGVPDPQPRRARYRTTGHGGQVVIVPTHCASGLHVLANCGYRICESGQTLQVTCQACVDSGRAEHSWLFLTNGQQAGSAEFDDGLYLDLINDVVPAGGR